ncbi:hypothetical protein ACTFIU_005893 [Dictyostelium citrinum]
MEGLYQWSMSWYTWIASFFYPRQIQNQIEQQDGQEPHSITINNNSNNSNNNDNNNNRNNNIPTTSQQRPTQQPQPQSPTQQQQQQSSNSFKNIDQKPTISLKDYKKKIKDYLNEEGDIDEDLIYSHIIHNLSLEESDTLEKQFKAMQTILSKVDNEKIKFSIVNTIIEHFKNVYSIQSKENLISFYAVLISFTTVNESDDKESEKFKKEISMVIKDLPPSVLGDIANRNASRVLLDLQEDVLESCRLDKSQMNVHTSLISGISSVLFDFINNHKQLPSSSSPSSTIIKNELIAALLQNLSPIFRSKLLFQHFIIYKLIQSPPESRQSIIDYLFSYKPQVKISINNNNNNSNTTTTTTTTTTTSS